MKYLHKNTLLKLSAVMMLIITVLIIHSCRKDSKSAPQTISDPAILQAKAWYESTYRVNTAGNTSHQATNSISNTQFNFSQHIKPAWKRASNYAKLGKNVIEMPLDSSAMLDFNLKNVSATASYYDKKYTSTYFLLMNDGKNYEAYVMMVIADPAYVKNDLSKLAHNTYRKYDADFSGAVLYFTPKGEYLNGYAYQNGTLLGASASSDQTVQSTTDPKLKTDVSAPVTCTDWYLITYDKQTGEILDTQYLYTICTGGTDGGGGPGSSTPPPPVPPKCTPPPGGLDATGHLTINVEAPPPGGGSGGGSGFPPPSDCTTTTTPAIQDIINNITNPCLKALITKLTSDNSIQNDVTSMLRNTFGASDQINITFAEGTLTGQYANDEAGLDGSQKNNFVVTFNTPKITNASQEFLLETAMHETYHAYLNVNPAIKGTLTQHQYMIQNYVNAEVTALRQIFPNLSIHNAQCLVLGGYGTLDQNTLNSAITSYGLTAIDVQNTNNNYESGTSGSKCP